MASRAYIHGSTTNNPFLKVHHESTFSITWGLTSDFHTESLTCGINNTCHTNNNDNDVAKFWTRSHSALHSRTNPNSCHAVLLHQFPSITLPRAPCQIHAQHAIPKVQSLPHLPPRRGSWVKKPHHSRRISQPRLRNHSP
jgi:hypothetical protein